MRAGSKPNGEFTDTRIHPTTGQEVQGRYLWTPYDGSVFPHEEEGELCCNPAPTELVFPPNYRSIGEDVPTLQASAGEQVGKMAEPSLELAASLGSVCSKFTKSCVGGDSYPNNCAHYLSNAFILAGYTELLTSSLITHRCRSGKKRPTRAKDMLKWFQFKKKRFHNGHPNKNTGVWAMYEEKDGQGHVLIVNSDTWKYCGTTILWDWPVQYCYQW